jgi:hypothetical protein
MTNQTASGGRWMGSDFRVGRILDRTISAYGVSAVSAVTLATLRLCWCYTGQLVGVPIQTRCDCHFYYRVGGLARIVQPVDHRPHYSRFCSRRSICWDHEIGKTVFPVLVLAIFVVLAISVFFIGVSIVIAVAAGVARSNFLSFVSFDHFSNPVLALIVVGLCWSRDGSL